MKRSKHEAAKGRLTWKYGKVDLGKELESIKTQQEAIRLAAKIVYEFSNGSIKTKSLEKKFGDALIDVIFEQPTNNAVGS